MEDKIVQYAIQSGLGGIAAFVIWINYKMATNHTKHIEAATERFTEAMDRNSDAWVKNAEALGELKEAIRK